MPTSFSPHEARFSGRAVIVASAVLLAIIAFVIYWLLATTLSTEEPAGAPAAMADAVEYRQNG